MAIFTVSLPGIPAMQVEADGPDEAFVEYKDRNGVISTKMQPKIERHEDTKPADTLPAPSGERPDGAGGSSPPAPEGRAGASGSVKPVTLDDVFPAKTEADKSPRNK